MSSPDGNALPGGGHTRSRRSPSKFAALGAGVTVVLLVAVVAGYRGRYGQWPWSPYPTTLHSCGRDFTPGPGDQSREQVSAAGYHLVRHGDTVSPLDRSPLWTFDTVHGEPSEALAGGCHVLMWIQGGSDAFRGYALEGGP